MIQQAFLQADIGLLTVVPVEQQALRGALEALGGYERHKAEDGTVYLRSTIDSTVTGRTYSIASACIGAAGNPNAAAATTAMIREFRPSLISLIGIAAGIRGRMRLGEVAYGESVVGYEPGVLVAGEFRPRPSGANIPHRIRQDLVNYEPDVEWLTRISEAIGNDLPSPLPQGVDPADVDAGPVKAQPVVVASGEKLLRDPTLLLEVRQQLDERTRVGEMEASGFAAACDRAAVNSLIVRGVADFGDGTKADAFQLYASTRAVLFALDFFRRGLELPMTPIPSDTRSRKRATTPPRLQGSAPPVVNPFHPVGTLPPTSQVYVGRVADDAVPAMLRTDGLLCLSGAPGIGKSSLLVRLGARLDPGWTIWYEDLSLFRRDSPRLFMDGFFRAASEALGATRDFRDLAARRDSTTVLLLDEIGSLGKLLRDFLPALCAVVTNEGSTVKVVAAVPTNLPRMLHAAQVDNPKHRRPWREISIELFDREQTTQLLEELPEQVRAVAMGRIEEIETHARGIPRRIQCLCDRLFSTVDAGAAAQLIRSASSYD